MRLPTSAVGGVLIVAAALVGCAPTAASWTATPSASPTPSARPLPRPAGTRPHDTVREGVLRFHPNSARVDPGVPYSFALYTHCWETMRIDFYGSHWTVVGVTDHDGKVPLEYGNPYDQGTLEVDAGDPDRAWYRSDRGDMTLELERLPGPVEIPICA